MCPGIPQQLNETVHLEIAHFEPIEVKVTVEGVYPTGMLTLPRYKDETYHNFLEEAKQRYDIFFSFLTRMVYIYRKYSQTNFELRENLTKDLKLS